MPDQFAYPFHYVPHEIAKLAAKELQAYLETQTEWEHDFGFDQGATSEIIGKMFGVLVVKHHGELGYLCAVSGRLAGQNLHVKIVPPVFDILPQDGFFRKGEAIITEINQRIFILETEPEFLEAKEALRVGKAQSELELAACRTLNKTNKQKRGSQRAVLASLNNDEEAHQMLRDLEKQSMSECNQSRQLKKHWRTKLIDLENRVAIFQLKINAFKEERKQRSAELQNEIFDQFSFVNRALERRSVRDIFSHTPGGRPVAGAGECAAPKLFQFAFLHNMEPIALAEFWWGQSPKTEIRLHGHYYPACRGKCEPILGHMLQGMHIEENPMLQNPAEGKELTIMWEDEYIVIVHKPHEFLSVPGKLVADSVLTRLQELYPQSTGPLLAHRLDMSTSGLMIAAKELSVYQALQKQFADREVKKRYVALLEGHLEGDEGWIDLPLRVDLDDRPRQMVCYTHGKPARTRWQVIERTEKYTRVHFFPITGRTHQLRVHAAHVSGLNHPILGDDIYGRRDSRLFLHAERIEFRHPISGKWMEFEVESRF